MDTVKIEVGWCPACGRMMQVALTGTADGKMAVEVGCACEGVEPARWEIERGQPYTLELLPHPQTKEGEDDDGADQGDL